MISGTDGADFEHRQRVAAHYQIRYFIFVLFDRQFYRFYFYFCFSFASRMQLTACAERFRENRAKSERKRIEKMHRAQGEASRSAIFGAMRSIFDEINTAAEMKAT